MGSSITGTIIGILMILPSIVFFIKFPPKNTPDDLKEVPAIFTILERVGQVGCLVSMVISKNFFDIHNINFFVLFMALCIVIYYGLWIRYVAIGQDYRLLLEPFLFIPIPLAIFPVLTFAFAALWGDCIWLGVFTVILAIGHITVTWNSYKQIKS